MLRLFIAVEIENQKCIETLKSLQQLLPKSNLKLTSDHQLHITLKFIGNTAEEKLDEIKNALKSISFLPFVIRFSEVGAFPNRKRPRVLWAGISDGSRELAQLANSVNINLEEIGIERDTRPFRAHITLARVRSYLPNAEKLLSKFYYYDFKGKSPDSVTSTVNNIVLKKSTLTPQGPIYEDLFVLSAKEKENLGRSNQ